MFKATRTGVVGEGKLVKDTFDQIFASDKYVKALERMRSMRKECKMKAESVHVELSYLEEQRHRSDVLAEQREEVRTKKACAQTEMSECSQQMDPLRVQIEALSKRVLKTNDIRLLLTKCMLTVCMRRDLDIWKTFGSLT